MKKRNGFVSNSSSSSFIVAVDTKEDYRIGEIEDCMGREYWNEGGRVETIPDVRSLIRYLHDFWCQYNLDETELRLHYPDHFEAIDSGKVIVDIEVDYRDDLTYQLIGKYFTEEDIIDKD